ncbi:MAG: SDR family NAD(P)-dependent oxidoreductase [Rhodococcus sp.]|nr:SDR family NAD(P)-dependent oxidoreductase [Rhodococcus sp. (in: high G+C Gram-positive bacteria)]
MRSGFTPNGSPDDLAPGIVLILGGRSEIGVEVATRIGRGRTVVLAARRSEDLEQQRQAVRDGGARAVHTIEFDADDLESHGTLLATVTEGYGNIGVVVLAYGILGNQQQAEVDAAHAAAIVHTDYVAQVVMLTHLTQLLREQGSGQIMVFSSVAGWRVRRANYVYGSAKAGLDGFASGLTDALHGSGVHLLLVRPGFVIGAMTAGMDPAPLSSTAPQVADAAVKALRARRETVWVPWVLQPAFFAMRLLPRAIWRRMPR